ncbi:thioredoxin family protein [Micromonospora aurantiaca]|uniref:thioredoxin family protein n=1 Tax=Micromonospora aurantiaca (nom. illeg.) TaxID=47850 RepID=UPI0037B115C1
MEWIKTGAAQRGTPARSTRPASSRKWLHHTRPDPTTSPRWSGSGRSRPSTRGASEQHPDVIFGEVDTEAEPALAAAAQIRSIPTLVAFRDGVLVFAQPGALPTAGLEEPIRAVRDLDMDEVRTRTA